MTSPLRPRLLVVWGLLLGLVVTIVLINRHERASEAPAEKPAADARRLLPAAIEQLGAIEIAHAGALHRFERDAAGSWFYHGHAEPKAVAEHAHQADPSAAEQIGKAFAVLARAGIERRMPLESRAAEYGVALPQMIVLLYRPSESQPLAQYAIGDVAPDAMSRYVLRMGSAEVVTIPDYQVGNLVNLVQAFATAQGPVKQPKVN